MFWWKSKDRKSTMIVENGVTPFLSREQRILPELILLQQLISDTEKELQHLKDYDFPMILMAIEKVGVEVAQFLDYPETSGMHLLTSHNSKSIMHEVMKRLHRTDKSDFYVDQFCREIRELYNREKEIEEIQNRIKEYKNYEQNLKEQLGIK